MSFVAFVRNFTRLRLRLRLRLLRLLRLLREQGFVRERPHVRRERRRRARDALVSGVPLHQAVHVRAERLHREQVRGERARVPADAHAGDEAPILVQNLGPVPAPRRVVAVLALVHHQEKRVIRRLRGFRLGVGVVFGSQHDLGARHEHRREGVQALLAFRGHELTAQRLASDDAPVVPAVFFVAHGLRREAQRVPRERQRAPVREALRVALAVDVVPGHLVLRVPAVRGVRERAGGVQLGERGGGARVRHQEPLAQFPALAGALRVGRQAEVREAALVAVHAQTVGPEPERQHHLVEELVQEVVRGDAFGQDQARVGQ